jgi:diguanylate cyclase (GGDEF)-like protein
VTETPVPARDGGAGRILVADDDWFSRQVYADCLAQGGHEVVTASDAEQALARLRAERFDLLVTDVVMPGMDGLELLERAKELMPHLDVIVLTGLDSVDAAVRAMRGGAHHYLVKPVSPEALLLNVRRCLESRRLVHENAELRRSFELFETTQRLLACLERDKLLPMALDALHAIAGADASFFCLGEPEGAAREVVARRGLEPAQAAWFAEQLAGAGATAEVGGLAVVEAVTPLPGLDGLTRAVLVPLGRRHAPAWVAVLRAAPFAAQALGNLTFLARNVALALDNSARYVQARALAHVDSLTGLHNARYLEMVLEREIARRQRTDAPFSVLFLDLDHFKSVNDRYGHQTGSKLLAELGRLLKRHVREQDVLVRYGGDEFVAVIADAGTEDALAAGERIRKAVEQHRFLAREGLGLRLSVCVGVATWPRHARSKEDVLHRADLAMYAGKHRDRNAVHVFDELIQATPTLALEG